MKGIFSVQNASKPGSSLCRGQTSRFSAQLRGLLTGTAVILSAPNMCLPPPTLRNPANAKTIRSQLRRALAKTIERQIARADHAGGNGAAHHQPEDEGPLAQKLQRRKIAQRLIEMIPKSSEPHLPEVAVYYGRVKCVLDVAESHYNKEPFYHCDFQNIATGEPLLTMNVSNGVWNHFTQETKDLLSNSAAELRISFLGKAVDSVRNGCRVVSLKNSEFLIVEKID